MILISADFVPQCPYWGTGSQGKGAVGPFSELCCLDDFQAESTNIGVFRVAEHESVISLCKFCAPVPSLEGGFQGKGAAGPFFELAYICDFRAKNSHIGIFRVAEHESTLIVLQILYPSTPTGGRVARARAPLAHFFNFVISAMF